jgi:uncharacterized protein (TIGR03067 family)
MSHVVALVLVSFTAAPVPNPDAAQAAREAMQGNWTVTWFLKDGHPLSTAEPLTGDAVVKGNKITLTVGDITEVGTFTLDPKADPAALDLTLDEKCEPVTFKAIYKLDKGKLTLCFAERDAARPVAFRSGAESRTILIVLERVKK